MEKITVIEIAVAIVIFVAAIGVRYIMNLLAERFNKTWLEIAGLASSVIIVIVGIFALAAWNTQTMTTILDEAVNKGYTVYINGVEVPEEEARETLAACHMRIDDEAQMVQIAPITNMRNGKKWHKGDPYETIYINGTKVDTAYVSPELYEEQQVFYDEDTKTLYIIAI